MSIKLFKLRGVPEDETEEIRQLLIQHDFDFYETEAGGWGISVPAIWIYNDARLDEAKSLIDVYQKKRTEQARSDYQNTKAAGQQQTLADKIRQKPVQSILFLLMSLFILYVSLAPFIHFAS